CSLHSSDDHRYLHPFPTRRSSDLVDHRDPLPPRPRDELLEGLLGDVGVEVDALDAELREDGSDEVVRAAVQRTAVQQHVARTERSEEHTSELQSRENLVCRLLLEK